MEGRQNKLKGHKTIVSILAVLTVMMLTLPAVGYALEQSAHTYNTGNSVGLDCFAVGYYASADSTEPITEIFVDHLGYSLIVTEDTKECIFAPSDGEVDVNINPLFVKVNDISGNNSSYSVSAKWTLVVNGSSVGLKDDVIPSMEIYIGDDHFTAGYSTTESGVLQNVDLEVAKSVKLSIKNVITEGANIPTSLGVAVTLTVSSENKGMYSSGVVNLKAGSAIDTLAAKIESTLKVSQGVTLFVHKTDDGVCLQRDPSEEAGGSMNFSFEIPEDMAFVMEFYLHKANTKTNVKIIIDGEVEHPAHSAYIAVPYSLPYPNEQNPTIVLGDRHYIWNHCNEQKQISDYNPKYTTNTLYTSDDFETVKRDHLSEDDSWFIGNTVKVQFDLTGGWFDKDTQVFVHLKDV